MAKQYEQFKKDFETIKHGVETAEHAVTSEKTTRQTLDGLVKEHGKEIGRRVRVLREQGTRGDNIDAFKADPQVKSLLAEANKHFTQMETQNARLKTLATGEWKKLSASRTTLEKDLTTEIAARKKDLSTKLGTGNKSLPDMQKLLVEAQGLTNRFKTLDTYAAGTAGQVQGRGAVGG
jgi:3-oxoacyl-(acyl-carrier-protein) synthase